MNSEYKTPHPDPLISVRLYLTLTFEPNQLFETGKLKVKPYTHRLRVNKSRVYPDFITNTWNMAEAFDKNPSDRSSNLLCNESFGLHKMPEET